MFRRALPIFASLAVLLGLPAAAAAGPTVPLFHLVSASVRVHWSYAYSGTDDDNDPFTETGSEIANLTMSRAVLKGNDVLGVYTAALTGLDTGQYTNTGPGTNVSCTYSLNPALVNANLQLNVVPLSHNRVEVNSGVSDGDNSAGSTALSDEFDQAQSGCGGYLPTSIGSSLDYGPAPNNVHTPQCHGIVNGCEIFSASGFHHGTVSVSITDSVPATAAADAVPPDHTGTETYAWTIQAVLKKG